MIVAIDLEAIKIAQQIRSLHTRRPHDGPGRDVLLLPVVLDAMLPLDAEGWRKLTFRWGLFFFVLAALNEIVWRTQTESFWIAFKAWGIMPLTLLFALSQTPLILRHEVKEPGERE
mgnify:CR=1 FL=1